jgi:DNA replication and repair protein RecF
VAKGRGVEVDAEVRKAGGLRVRVNRVLVQASEHRSGGIACVLFSPEDLALVKGEPEQRRRLLDQAAAQIRPRADAERQEFERVLRQRNGAVKAAQINPRALDSLDVWDEQLIRAGASVVRNRLEVVEMLASSAGEHCRDLGGEGADLDLIYRPTWTESVPEADALDEVLAGLRESLASSRARDIERGFTHTGPHRDDLEIRLSGAEARIFASQGEQRTIALALRLGIRDIIAEVRQETPILLLDDVFSELDDRRRGRLGELIDSSAQTIGTATGIQGMPVAPRRVLTIKDGVLAE